MDPKIICICSAPFLLAGCVPHSSQPPPDVDRSAQRAAVIRIIKTHQNAEQIRDEIEAKGLRAGHLHHLDRFNLFLTSGDTLTVRYGGDDRHTCILYTNKGVVLYQREVKGPRRALAWRGGELPPGRWITEFR